jgi:hypothetical protein
VKERGRERGREKRKKVKGGRRKERRGRK